MVVLAFFCSTAGHIPLFFLFSLCFKKALFVKNTPDKDTNRQYIHVSIFGIFLKFKLITFN